MAQDLVERVTRVEECLNSVKSDVSETRSCVKSIERRLLGLERTAWIAAGGAGALGALVTSLIGR